MKNVVFLPWIKLVNDTLESDNSEETWGESGDPTHQQHRKNYQRRDWSDIALFFDHIFHFTWRFTHVSDACHTPLVNNIDKLILSCNKWFFSLTFLLSALVIFRTRQKPRRNRLVVSRPAIFHWTNVKTNFHKFSLNSCCHLENLWWKLL